MSFGKRTYLPVLALISALVFSCKSELDPDRESPSGSDFVFTATTEVFSRTTVEDGEGSERIVKWARGDRIDIWWDSEGHTTASADEAGSSVTFSPAITPGVADDYYAAYPSGTATAFSDGTMSVRIPASQDGSFAMREFLLNFIQLYTITDKLNYLI